MPRKFAKDLRARRRKLSEKAEDLKDGAARLRAARGKAPELLPTTGIEENAIHRAEEFKEKAVALNPAIRLEEIGVFTYSKAKSGKAYSYWKAEWRAPNGRMKQVHLGPAQGEKGLSEDAALAKARRAKAEDLGLRISLK